MKTKIIVAALIIAGIFFLLPEPETSSAGINTLRATQQTATSRVVENSSAVADNKELFNHSFVLRNLRVYDGNKVFENVDVLIESQIVVKIGQALANPNQYPELDGRGKTLIPGLIDSHTHVWGDVLAEALNFGVTTELDMFTMPENAAPQKKLRDQANNINQADLFSATILATAPKGHGTQYGNNIPVLSAVSQVEEFVQARKTQGADYIKTVYNAVEAKLQFSPSISQEILVALIKSAHQNQLMLVVHVDNHISAVHAIEAGADGLVHSFMDQLIDDELVSKMVEQNAFMIPTLTVEASMVGIDRSGVLLADKTFSPYYSRQQKQQLNTRFPSFGIPQSGFDNALQSVAKLSKAGVTILAGSDAPNPGTTHGVSIHDELNLLVKAGLTPEQALHSATGAASKVFNIGNRGQLVTGAMASMILLDGNPVQDISHSKNILRIWKNGMEFQRKLFDEKVGVADALMTGLISDFNHSEDKKMTETRMGIGLSATTDQYASGNSIVALTLVGKKGANDRYLNIKGEIKTGFIFPWSGVAFVPGKSYRQGANLTQIKSLNFDAKGSRVNQQISVMLFQQGSSLPATQVVNLSKNWQNIVIDLNKFNVDLSQVSNISLVVNGRKGAFEFMLDNLSFR